jgi:hypothetical protein
MYRSRLARFLYQHVKAIFARPVVALVPALVDQLGRIPVAKIGIFLGEVDGRVTERLAGEDLLQLAQAVDALDPAHIDTYMPMLARRKKHLERAKEFADLFQEDALNRLIQALEVERTEQGADGAH